MPTLLVDPRSPEPDRIERAADVIRSGGLVAFPTETVYGLGANALDEAAVAGIYRAKGRPEYNPLIVHVADAGAARSIVTAWPDAAERLAAAFWPGPLTLVLPRHSRIPAMVSAGLSTVAVRVPAHPVAAALLRAAGVPIVAPSANPSMAVSPTRAEHVVKGLGDRVDLVLDGGPTGVGIESTVVSLAGGRPVILRPGALSADQLRTVVGEIGTAAAPGPGRDDDARPSPGMLDRHYAPRAAVVLFDPPADTAALERARRVAARGGVVCGLVRDAAALGPETTGDAPFRELVRMPPDPKGYARDLYAALHRMDDMGCELLLVEAVPDSAAWAGVRDRLARAAERASG